jgi:hypothetical protein
MTTEIFHSEEKFRAVRSANEHPISICAFGNLGESQVNCTFRVSAFASDFFVFIFLSLFEEAFCFFLVASFLTADFCAAGSFTVGVFFAIFEFEWAVT